MKYTINLFIVAISAMTIGSTIMNLPVSAQVDSDFNNKCRVGLKIFVSDFDKTATEAQQGLMTLIELRDFIRHYSMPKCELSSVVSVLRTSKYFHSISVGRTSLTVEPLAHIRFEINSIVVRMLFKVEKHEFDYLNGASVNSIKSP